jgi:2-methylcitrate dehydratase PrpD
MAHKGFTANPQIFDGASSIFSTYGTGDGQDLGSLIPSLGNPWQINAPGIYVKRWPCCYCNHRPVGGLLQLINKHNIQPDEVTAIEIGFVRGSDDALISTNPQTGLEGKFSIEYVAAATVLDRKLVLNTFTDAMVQRPAIRQLMSKTRRYRVDDPNFYTSKTGYTDIAITTTRSHFPMRVTEVSGSPQWPMTEEERQEKFMGCASLALGEQASATLLHELQRFATLPSLTTLVTAPITR